ncbi:division/cell wall cluster transcriptional repressor MraZ [Thorsellia kenyensis]|uniref:Transcriptional regulator MraZ n=1 Tax=Thorsellia kenyensis TaxID=1549888 RepID=A0ABV6CBN6_9GAMM
MFRGSSSVNLDTKGRIVIPTKYREELNDNAEGQLVCTIDLHQPCLLLYPLQEWEIIEKKLATLSSLDPQERRVKRLLLGHASECQMDSAGRVLIAPTLRQHAKLDKAIMIVGQLNKFEIWDETAWQLQINQDIEDEKSIDSVLTDRLRDFAL